jgi:pyridoxine 5-phosphate synthase
LLTLGVNIDHVATIRQARRTVEPDPIAAAVLAELAGADGITAHLREDRRHMQDRDIWLLRETVRTHLNLEMAATVEMVQIALDIAGQLDRIKSVVDTLQSAEIPVSLFIDPEPAQIDAAAQVNAKFIELHTGRYAEAKKPMLVAQELANLAQGCELAIAAGLRVNAGHGLTYWNVRPIACLPGMEELNIGHSIISRSVLVGIDRAIREMKAAMLGVNI